MSESPRSIFVLSFVVALGVPLASCRGGHCADCSTPGFVECDEGMTEKQKIEALIRHVEELKDAKFVRNDKEYDSKTAAEFLRSKWKSQTKDIRTARDFIEKAATRSSTSGKPYLIRRKDGSELKSADYLLRELEKLEAVTSEPTRRLHSYT